MSCLSKMAWCSQQRRIEQPEWQQGKRDERRRKMTWQKCSRLGSGHQPIRGTTRAIEERGGDRIAKNFLFQWIPTDGARDLLRDVAKMTDGGAAMTNFDVSDGALARTYAGEEI